MKNLFKVIVFVLPAMLVFPSCEKDKKTVEDPGVPAPIAGGSSTISATGTMKVEFHNMVDSDPLEYGKMYKNPHGDPYTISKFNYYISNIVLTKNDNSKITIANQYQIIEQADDTTRTIKLKGVPEGSYKAIRLILGVDSARNKSGAQSGGLDVNYASDMYWGWNQGYIFLKLEGTSDSSATKSITFHMGGASGVYKTQREINIDFVAAEANVTKTSTPTLHLNVDVNEMFKSPALIAFSVNSNAQSAGTKIAKTIADNYADMIKYGSIKN
ncbi:hypothetical protein CNR22_17510 [Sphingobacteriaceae bacterium]|nr:hypothetical protein CNR22_17510 [Sphingobacteriaceae bacterium]